MNGYRTPVLIVLIFIAVAACSSSPPATALPAPARGTPPPQSVQDAEATPTEAIPHSDLSLFALGFKDGDQIPAKFTCDGENYSPALEWRGAPAQTQSFALIVSDSDAGDNAQWVLYDIPASATGLPEDASGIGVSGINEQGKTGYTGPCPPPGETHHYVFKLYALDVASLNLPGAAGFGDGDDARQDHVLGGANMTGTYKR